MFNATFGRLNSMLLSVEKLSFSYPNSGKRALDSVSFTVPKGEYIAVLGANGSGKSTLARCITGLLAPESGTVNIDSENRVPSALVFQSPGDQIVAETVELDVAFGPENLGISRDEMHVRVPAALESFGLAALSKTDTHDLTSGQKQHLALAGALVLDPSVLVLDEPTSMLSMKARESVLSFLDRFHADGGTIIHITHDLTEATRAERILVMDDGHTVFDGSTVEFGLLPVATLDQWGLYGVIPENKSSENAPVEGSFDRSAGSDRSYAIENELAEPVLECQRLDYGPLRNFSVAIQRGTITAITGESGSGKTLLLELLAGLRIPSSGSVIRAEGQIATLAVQESESSLFAEFVADDIAFGPRNEGLTGEALVSRVSSAMEMVGLPFAQFADRRTFTLSGGERRKAALAGIIAMDTPIILMDEPSSALDTRSRSQLLAFIKKLKDAGKTVVFTTSRPEECAVADVVLTLPVPPAKGAESCANEAVCRKIGVPGRQKRAREQKKKYTRDQLALERLRRGASGLRSSCDSPLHRVTPVCKYIFLASVVTGALAIRGWVWILFFILLEMIPVLVSRYSLRKLGTGILKILPWLVILGVIQYLISPDWLYPVVFIMRFVALYIPLSIFIFVTAHTEIMYGMEDFLIPVRFLGVPVRDVSLVTGIVFRFIPLLYDEAARITTARIIRGAGAKRKRGLLGAIQSMTSLFVPLVLRTLTRADRLSQAITARYYGSGKNSRYLHWKTGIGQRILVLAVPAFVALLILFSVLFGK